MTNLLGHTFGRLRVIEPAREDEQRYYYWLCRCQCGREKVVRQGNLLSGNTKSCGCLRRDEMAKIGVRHGAINSQSYTRIHGHCSNRKPSPTYITWQRMHNRCFDKGSVSWKNYGGRGIKICDYWNTFENFLEDMGERPPGKTIDRIDPNGHYVPSNCRWATRQEQSRNRRV